MFSISTLALAVVQTGCGSPDVEPLDDISSTSEAPAARTGFIALTPISADRTPVLHHLAGELQATSAQGALDSLRSGAAERSDLHRRTGAVIADMAAVPGGLDPPADVSNRLFRAELVQRQGAALRHAHPGAPRDLTCTGNPNQKFVLRPVGAYRSIMNVNSQKCLSVEDASAAGYAQIVQEPCNTALPEQLFLPR
ncbi:RICIN domain-containing protein [Sorangium sp. So ce363]|uniref:RICIN domain-containing protein n=1 Tax=Sorangium sp. So ce363 TaxID=3133304 RepID=UPI003F5D7AC9